MPRFQSEYDLSKSSPSFSRVMSWNIFFDAFLDPDREAETKAVITSLNPDIIAFQEMYNTPLSEVADFLNESLPNADGSSWQYGKAGPDNTVFTRNNLEAVEHIDGNGVFLLYDEDQNPMIIYNVHHSLL